MISLLSQQIDRAHCTVFFQSPKGFFLCLSAPCFYLKVTLPPFQRYLLQTFPLWNITPHTHCFHGSRERRSMRFGFVFNTAPVGTVGWPLIGNRSDHIKWPKTQIISVGDRFLCVCVCVWQVTTALQTVKNYIIILYCIVFLHIILHSIYVNCQLLDRHSDVLRSTITCSNMLIYNGASYFKADE